MARKKKKSFDQNIDIQELLNNENIITNSFSDELEQSMLPYSILTIVDRALPDARDGLKPVQRRILWTAAEEHYDYNKRFVKSAQLTGDVMGHYHPHSDCYGTIVLLSQPWNMRYPLMDFQGNNGSLDGDPPASHRYTETRLHKIASEVIEDALNKHSVPFKDNYAETLTEPEVMPSLFPNYLVNGALGIAVGYTTKTASHNLNEICDGIIAYIKNNQITVDELMKYIPGPDFPLGGIMSKSGIKDYYETGKGKISFRASYSIEEAKNGNTLIVFDSLPPEVNKPDLIDKIAELIASKAVTRCVSVRDESKGIDIRIVIECLKTAAVTDIIQDLYSMTGLQSNVSFISRAVLGSVPKMLSLKQSIKIYKEHQENVISKRLTYINEVNKKNIHLWTGLYKITQNISKAVQIITESESPQEAGETLMKEFDISEEQANRALDMKLRQLTRLDKDKLKNQIDEAQKEIDFNLEILGSDEKLNEYLIQRLEELKLRWGDERRTTIVDTFGSAEITEDEEDCTGREIITVSVAGKVKCYDEETFAKTNGFKDKNFLFKQVLFADRSDEIIVVHSNGNVSKARAGKFEYKYDKIDDFVGMFRLNEDSLKTVFVIFSDGSIKKVPVSKFTFRESKGGQIAKDLNGRTVSLIRLIDDRQEETALVCSENGYISRFSTNSFTSNAITARPVNAVKFEPNDIVTEAVIMDKDAAGKVVIFAETNSGEPLIKVMSLNEIAVRGRTSHALRCTSMKNFGYLKKAVYVPAGTDKIDYIDYKHNVHTLNVNDFEVIPRVLKCDSFDVTVSPYHVYLDNMSGKSGESE